MRRGDSPPDIPGHSPLARAQAPSRGITGHRHPWMSTDQSVQIYRSSNIPVSRGFINTPVLRGFMGYRPVPQGGGTDPTPLRLRRRSVEGSGTDPTGSVLPRAEQTRAPQPLRKRSVTTHTNDETPQGHMFSRFRSDTGHVCFPLQQPRAGRSQQCLFRIHKLPSTRLPGDDVCCIVLQCLF